MLYRLSYEASTGAGRGNLGSESRLIGSLRIDDFHTSALLGHLIVPRRRPVEIWIYDSQ